MFYEQIVLAKKGILGNVWLAAHWEKRLKKSQISSTDISQTTESIANPSVPLALRLSGHLLLGVVKIYSKKVYYLYSDASDALVKIKMAFRPIANVDLEDSVANLNAITLPEAFQDYEIQLPELPSEDFYDEGIEEEVLTLNPIRQKEMISMGQPEFPIPSMETQEESIPNLLLSQDDFLEIDAGRNEYYEEPDYLAEGDISHEVLHRELPDITSQLFDHELEMVSPHEERIMDIIREESESESLELVIPEVQRAKRKLPTLFDPETQLSSEFIQRRLNNPEMFTRELYDPPSTKRAFVQYERETASSDDLLNLPSIDELPEVLVRALQNRMHYQRLDESIDMARGEVYSESIEEPSIASLDHGVRVSDVTEMLPVDEFIPELPDIREEEEELEYEYAPTLRPSEVDESILQLSERGQRMNVYLQKHVDEDKKLNFDSHFEGKKKRTVAISFWTLLELKSKNYIDLRQQEPYGNIEIEIM